MYYKKTTKTPNKKMENSDRKMEKSRSNYLVQELKRWAVYSLIFAACLTAYTGISLKTLAGGIILGFFAGILNDIRTRL